MSFYILKYNQLIMTLDYGLELDDVLRQKILTLRKKNQNKNQKRKVEYYGNTTKSRCII